MRKTSRPHWTILLALLASPVIALASSSRTLHDPAISPDGAWVAVVERSGGGEDNVRVWSTKADVTYTIARGRDPRISRDSRWVSALLAPLPEDAGTVAPKDERGGRTLVLLDLQDGSRRTFDFVLSYDLTHASTYLLYLQSPEANADGEGRAQDEATKPSAPKRTMGTLHQVPLNHVRLSRLLRPYHPDEAFTTEHVIEFAAHPKNDHFAYVFHDGTTGGDTLHVVKWGVRAQYHGDRIEGLCWAGGADGGDDSIILGFVDTTVTSDEVGTRRASGALSTWRPGQAANEGFTRVDTPR